MTNMAMNDPRPWRIQTLPTKDAPLRLVHPELGILVEEYAPQFETEKRRAAKMQALEYAVKAVNTHVALLDVIHAFFDACGDNRLDPAKTEQAFMKAREVFATLREETH